MNISVPGALLTFWQCYCGTAFGLRRIVDLRFVSFEYVPFLTFGRHISDFRLQWRFANNEMFLIDVSKRKPNFRD